MGIFATAGVFATTKCVIYIVVHNLCMFSFDFADVRVPPPACIIGFHRIFFVTISKILKYAIVGVISRITKTKIFSNVNDVQ